jgi:phage tail sheath protein FI
MVEGRGDCFLLVDPVIHNSSITTVTTEAATRNSSYTAMYWPWLKIADNALGKNVNVPASVVIPGVFAFNDKIAHPWFVPGGLNRGGLDVVGIERKLRQSNRDDLYDANVNPIASFPGQGISVWGQKTLQKKASALDRINVRRLLIFVKKFITNVSRTIEFEPNSIATRNRFLNIVNPFLEQIKANEGLNEFRVIMDDTNNPPELQDRNILYGQVVLNPTRSIEFILLDFSVEPTGANFDS